MLYIVTPCSRPENLEAIKNSIFENLNLKDLVNLQWIVIFDGKIEISEINKALENFRGTAALFFQSGIKNALVGHAHRNYILNFIQNGSTWLHKSNDWIYFLDDDTLLHPDFLHIVMPELKPFRKSIIFDQINKDGSPRLFANHGQIKVCHIDMGQYVVNLKHIPKTLRFKEDDYCADGIFIEEFYNMTPDKASFHIINKPCSIYNALR